jgi:hypothetical protein
MEIYMIKGCATALALVWATSTVLAGQPGIMLMSAQGKVLVNAGKGFVAAEAGAALKPGQTIMVGQDSTATLSHGTCQIDVKAEALFTVPEKAPCSDGAVAAVFADTLITPANSHDGGGFGAIDPETGLFVLGGLVLTGGVATYFLTRHHKKRGVTGP